MPIRVSTVLLRSCTLSCTYCCVSRCEQMLEIFRWFFFLTFSDSALPDVIMIACGATLNRGKREIVFFFKYGIIYLSDFVKTWPLGFRLASGAARPQASPVPKNVGGLTSWSVQLDSPGTSLTVGGRIRPWGQN